MPSSALALLGRIGLSVIFILSGFGKLTNVSGTAQYFQGYALPAPTALAVIVGLVELLGGLLILIGFRTRAVAVVMALFTLATAFVAHMNWADMMQMIQFQKNLAIAGGFLVLAAFGPGAYSLDGRRTL